MTQPHAAAPEQKPRLSMVEFVAMLAMLFATVAFSIDAMLPALTVIAETLTPEAPNRAQLVVTSFVLGMGIGTFVTGPLSDAFGRKPVLVAGASLYCLGAAAGWAAGSLEMVLAARLVQGLGAAGPRVVAMAVVRDLYKGRDMARIISFIMVVFTLVPALAPLLGQGIIRLGGWRSIFPAFLVFSMASMTWFMLRQHETLPRAARRPLRGATIRAALSELAGLRVVRLSILTQTMIYGMLFSLLSSIQQIFEGSFGRADSFPLWFGTIALIASSASFLNARLVRQVGMRSLIRAALIGQICCCLTFASALASGLAGDALFYAFVIWAASVFFQIGLTIGNLNALAMEPVGHIAGMAASIISALATVLAVLIAVPIGLAFDGTPMPVVLGVLLCSSIALAFASRLERHPPTSNHPEPR